MAHSCGQEPPLIPFHGLQKTEATFIRLLKDNIFSLWTAPNLEVTYITVVTSYLKLGEQLVMQPVYAAW